MTHYGKINGKSVAITACCKNDGIEDNICPTGFGNCTECRFFGIEIEGEGTPEAWKLLMDKFRR